MQIYLLDRSGRMTVCWERAFRGVPNVTVVCKEFDRFMYGNKVECVVSPANAYGFMDGGYDLAITQYFGEMLQISAQKYITQHYYGEQPVGTGFIIPIPNSDVKLMHVPSMRVPSAVADPLVVYQCMRTVMMLALDNNIQSIVIPAFGGGCGGMKEEQIAALMREGYDQVMDPPKYPTWRYAWDRKLEEKYRNK